MIVYLALFGCAVVFFELFVRLRLLDDAAAILVISRGAFGQLSRADLGDAEKERLARRSSVAIFSATARFASKFALICGVLYVLYLGLVAIAPGLREPFLHAIVAPVPLVALTVGMVVYARFRGLARRRPGTAAS